jgi:pantoate--beta-alanine ligase
MSQIPVARTINALRRQVAVWRTKGERVALVPTMGALHEGHIALVKLARRKAERVIVSVFVNPTQFAPHEDFTKYPRTFARDRLMLTGAKADLIWAPTVPEMYPVEFCTRVLLLGPAAAGLEDRFRPTHFEGVATVCAKLLTQSKPDYAIFGEKDYQQLKVVTRMAADLDLGLKIVPMATFREPDGLAMSSRNRYLTPEERALAPVLHKLMQEAAADMRAGASVPARMAKAQTAVIAAGFELEYLEVRHTDTLAMITSLTDGPLRMLLAVKLGSTRLIDNIAV